MSMLARCLLMIAVLILLWQTVVWWFQLPDYILPTPGQVIKSLYEQWHLLVRQAGTTIIETVSGFLLGILFGCSAGCIVALWRPLSLWLLPLLIISQAIPTFAIAPLLVMWLGYGLASKIATAILMVFFPVASAFYDGLRRTQREWLDLAKTMNASTWRIFLHIRIPAALPALASGIRIAAVSAPMGAVIGEWVGSSQGLGYLMLNANARMQIDLMFAALLMIIMMSLVLYFSVDKILQKLIWWHT